MKTLNISFDLYEDEIRREYAKGYKAAMLNAKQMVEEFSAGKSEDDLMSDHWEDNIEVEFIKSLFRSKQ